MNILNPKINLPKPREFSRPDNISYNPLYERPVECICVKDKVPDQLKKLIKYSSYKPSNLLIEKVRKNEIFNSHMIQDEIKMFISIYMDKDKFNEASIGLQKEIVTAIAGGLAELAKYQINNSKHEVDITFHAADRFTHRYSNDYSLVEMIKTSESSKLPKEREKEVAEFFRKVMHPTLLRIYKKGKDPYKFRKTNMRLAEYLEHKKKLHNKGNIKVKVYGDSIWIFEMCNKVAVLKTMYSIPMNFFYRPPEDEKIESFYDLLVKEKLINETILIGEYNNCSTISFGRMRIGNKRKSKYNK